MRHPSWAPPAVLMAAFAAGCACTSMGTVRSQAPDVARRSFHADGRPLGVGRELLAAGGGMPGSGYVGVGVQGLFPSENSLSNGFGFDVSYTANAAENLSIEFSLGRAGYDIDGAGAGAEFTAVTLGAVAQIGIPFGAARWYAGGGLAYWMNDLSAAAVEADDSIAWVVAAGTDLPVSTNGNLCIELRYVLAEADLSTGGALDLNAFGARLSYVFKY